MLTIRHYSIHGDETIFQATMVVRGSDAQHHGEHGMLEFYDAAYGHPHDPIFFGRVYVMNDCGQTVADYNMGGWEYVQKITDGVG